MSKKHWKRVKLFYANVLYCHVHKTTRQYTALYTTYSHVLDSRIKAVAANWCLIVRTWGGGGVRLQLWLSAQCWANGINIWPNAVGISNRPLGIQKFVWVNTEFIEVLIKKKNLNQKILKTIKHDLWIHFFIRWLKNKIYVIPQSSFQIK